MIMIRNAQGEGGTGTGAQVLYSYSIPQHTHARVNRRQRLLVHQCLSPSCAHRSAWELASATAVLV